MDETVSPIDMVALLESLVDDQTESGRDVSLTTPASLRFSGRPQALRRAIGNLIDNALNIGKRATVELRQDKNGLRIVVEDEGSGCRRRNSTRSSSLSTGWNPPATARPAVSDSVSPSCAR